MKNPTSAKGTLFLMELVLAILFFSVSAAVCASVFAKADYLADKSRNISFAVSEVSSAASYYKAENGNLEKTSEFLGGTSDGSQIVVTYNKNWEKNENDGKYFVYIVPQNSFSARIYACDAEGNIFADINAAVFGGNIK
jgi:hypothetical protein